MQEKLRKMPLEHPYGYNIRLFKLEIMPEFDVLQKKTQAIDKQHAKTLPVRQRLIELRRIELDHVTPKIKGLQKLLLKLKVNF